MVSKKKAAKDTAPAASSAKAPQDAPKPSPAKSSPSAASPTKTAKPVSPSKPAAAAPAKPAAAKGTKSVKPAAKTAAKPPKAAPPAPPAPLPPMPATPTQATAEKPGAKAGTKPAAKPAPKPAPKPASSKVAAEKPAGAPKPPAASKPQVAPKPPVAAKPTAITKPPVRRSFAALDDVDSPDDDDLEGDEGEARSSRAPVIEAEEPLDTPPPPPRRLTPRVVPPMPARKPGVITMAVSPDADDAYMLYALVHGKIETEDRRYEITRGEIAHLNDEACKGTYDVSAFSFGAWGPISERYLMLPTGASLGDGVGPVVVSKTVVRPNEVNGLVVGVPGVNTTAALVLRLWLHPARLQLVSLPFDGVIGAVKEGKVRAGVLIHEAQLTYRLDGLAKVVDLGRWWTDRTDGLPLPLGGMVVRRDVPPEERAKISLDLKRSIAYAMGHRDEALTHAAQFSKGLPRPLLERYIANYVNELTLDLGERGKQAVQALFDASLRLGMTREPLELEMA